MAGLGYGTDPDDAYKAVYLEYREWVRNLGQTPSSHPWTSALFGRPSRTHFPCVMDKIKAAHMKGMCFFIAMWMQTCVRRVQKAGLAAGDIQVRLQVIATLMWAVCDFMYVTDTSPLIMTAAQRGRAYTAGHIFLNLYHALAEEAMQAHHALWQITPKFHYYCHVLDQIRSSAFNPRWSHCFLDESFMGCITRIIGQTHGRGSMLRAMQRYILFLAIRWQHQRDTLV